MKQLLFLLFAGAATSGMAQISISQSDLPLTIGTIIYEANDTTKLQPGGSGANQNWDFSGLKNTGGSVNTALVDPATAPGTAFFAGASLAINDGKQHIFVRSTANLVEALGIYESTPLKFDKPLVLIKFPAAYQGTYSGISKISIAYPFNNPPADSSKIIITIDYKGIYDGWGTLKTPKGTYDALREKSTQVQTDSTFIRAFGQWSFVSAKSDTTITYKWWVKGEWSPLELEYKAGKMTEAKFVLPDNATGINTSEGENKLIVYPNPTFDLLNFSSLPSSGELSIYDVLGKQMGSYKITDKVMQMNTSNLPVGIYYYRITDATKRTQTGRFKVSK